MEETGVPGKNHRLTPSHWQLSLMPKPGFEPRQRQSAVSGGALDHTVSWQTPTWAPQWSTRYVYFGPKNSFSSYFHALKVELILFSTSCAYFMTKRIVVLTIFILDHEKMTFFPWNWMSLLLVQILSLIKQRNRRTDETEIDRSFTYNAHCTWWPLTFLPTS